ncbi:Bromodomain-containing protein, partial [Spinellus fusiger]
MALLEQPVEQVSDSLPAFEWKTDDTQHQTPRAVLRTCTFVLDELVSCSECFPFVQPVPRSATYYHQEIKQPMDLLTLENNLYRGIYQTFEAFEKDLTLIWENAKHFHRSFDTIYHQAEELRHRFEQVKSHIHGGESYIAFSTSCTDPSIIPVPEEEQETPQPIEAACHQESYLYFIQAVNAVEKGSKATRGFTHVRPLYNTLNYRFFHYVNVLKSGGSVPSYPFPRLYITKNRTLLTEARHHPHGMLAVMTNVMIAKCTDNPNHCRLLCDVVLVRPLGECHSFDETTVDPAMRYEYFPKAWSKVRIVRVVTGVSTLITVDMEKCFFRRAFTTYRLSFRPTDVKKAGDANIVGLFMKAIMDPKQGEHQDPLETESLESIGSMELMYSPHLSYSHSHLHAHLNSHSHSHSH